MRVESILISDIKVGQRRRDDFGDLGGLWKENDFDGDQNVEYKGYDETLSLRADSPALYPSTLPEHWHLSIIRSNKEVLFTAYPEWRQKIPAWFRRHGVNPLDFIWHTKLTNPFERNPYSIPESERALFLVPPIPTPTPTTLVPILGTSYVYFVQAGNDGLIKIGVSTNPTGRLRALRCASPVELRPLGLFEGDMCDEQTTHMHFHHLRERGEWFRPDAELLAFIEREADPWPR